MKNGMCLRFFDSGNAWSAIRFHRPYSFKHIDFDGCLIKKKDLKKK